MTNPRTSSTTDPQDELFDILDADGLATGERKPRWQVHRDGDWHAALHIWVGGVRDDGATFVLFQRRSSTKDTWPGFLDIAVGGHVRAGEALLEAAREAEEEIGLAVTLDGLTLLGRRFISGCRAGVIDRELQYIYALRNDEPLASYRLHPEEVSAIVALSITDARGLFAGAVESIPAIERGRDTQTNTPIELRRADFAGLCDDYPLRALAGLEALLNEQPPVPFEVRSSLPESA